MRTALSWIGRALLFAAIALCFAPTIVPPFLDRVYHDGPPSDHYDGARFFNPGAAQPMRRGSILDRWGGARPLPKMPKTAVADAILSHVLSLRAGAPRKTPA